MKMFIAEAVQVLSAARNPDSRSDHGHNRTARAFRRALLALLALGLLGGISQAQEPLVIAPDGGVSIAKTLSVGGKVSAPTLDIGDGVVLDGKAGRNVFKDIEKSDGNGLRVGAAWGMYGIWANTGQVVVGGTDGVNLQNGKVVVNTDGNVGIGTAPTANKLSVSGGASFTGSVGIGTASAPAATLDVAGDAKVSGEMTAKTAKVTGDLRAASVQATSVNGERAPIVLTLGAKNNTGNGKWSSLQVDIGPYCADDDGCTIRLLMQNLKDWEVKIAEELIMIRAVGAYSFFGHTRQFGGGEWNNWVLNHGDKKFRLFNDPSDWCRADNYPGDWAFERNGTALSKTNISITCKPNIDARIIIYDR